jgi:hypothetical protein
VTPTSPASTVLRSVSRRSFIKTRSNRLTKVDVLACIAILVQICWRSEIVARAVMRQDDFLLAAQAHRRGLLVIFDEYHGHIQLIGWVVSWVADRLGPLEHWPIALITMTMQTIASVLGWLAIRKLVGPRPAALLGLAILLFSPMTVGPLVWWAAAMQMLTLQIAILGSVLVHARAVERGTSSSIVGAWVFVGLSLLANEKALVVPPLLLALAAVSSWQSLRESLRVDRSLWLGYAGLMFGELVLYLSIARGEGFQPAGDLLVLVRDGFAGTWLPQITAMPISGSEFAPLLNPAPTTAVVLAALFAVAAFVFAATRVGRRALLTAGLMFLYVAAQYGVIAVSRLGFGDLIAIDPRYVAETVPVAALCLALATARRPGDRPMRIGRVEPRERSRMPALLIACLLAIGYAVSAIPTTAATAAAGRKAGNSAYLANVRRDLAGRDLTLVDGPVPERVVSGLFGIEDRLSKLISVLPGHRKFAGLTEQPYVVDDLGRLRRAAPGPLSITINGPSSGCGWSVLANEAIQIPSPDPLTSGTGIVRIGYVLGADTPAVVEVAGQRISSQLSKGLGHLNIVVDRPVGPIVVSGVAENVRLCVSDVTVGPAAPE